MSVNSGRLYARLLGGAAVLALSAGIAQAEPANFNIAPQPLALAVGAFSEQSGRPVLLKPELAGKLSSKGVSGSLEPEMALAEMLSGTGLTYRKTGDTFLIESASDPQSGSAGGDGADQGTVAALIVTAQKKEENVQDVPIAISAFTEKSLEEQKIEGGFDLLKAIPNVTFSKNNFSSYNFSIRGIGTKAVSVATDPGVAVEFNSTALIRNRLFEQEYFDVERVEVLRGPQGTLHGRNATAGVINVISAKPNLQEFSGWLKGEVGNYHTKRLSAMTNIPLIEDKLALRLAGAMTDRAGYDYNSVTKHQINGRDLWSARATLSFEPTEQLHADLIWERFNEDDNRSRTGKQLCHRDPGAFDYTLADGDVPTPLTPSQMGSLSQGCKMGSLYDDGAFGTPNGYSIPFIIVAAAGDAGLQRSRVIRSVDPYGGLMQSRDLRTIASVRDPTYKAKTDVVELNVSFDLTDKLTISSQTAYDKDFVYSIQDYNRFNSFPVFSNTSDDSTIPPGNYYGQEWSCFLRTFPPPFSNDQCVDFRGFAPGGIFNDPQIGPSNTIAGLDLSTARSTQFSQEIRIESSFDGPFNFSAGANYLHYKTLEDYYVMFNLITALSEALMNGSPDMFHCPYPVPALVPFAIGLTPDSPIDAGTCVYIDPNPIESMNGEGHNYFRSKNPYRLKSYSVFGESYWQVTDALKLTVGLRYTDDRKIFTPVPSQVLLSSNVLSGGTVDRGYPEEPDIKQHWGEVTGRVGVDWQPKLSWTDKTMVYAFYSRGYKGGGANPPGVGFLKGDIHVCEIYPALCELIGFPPDFTVPPIIQTLPYPALFEPEFVNAFEVGSKNTLLSGALVLNGDVFYYDYRNYQVSQIKDRTAVNENFDAKVWGLELEALFQPTHNLRLNGTFGYQASKIANGEQSIDLMDRTAGNPDWVVVKPWIQIPSNCVMPVADVLHVQPSSYLALCPGYRINNPPLPQEVYDSLPNGGAGFFKDVGGNTLPNAPHWTVSMGAQYSHDILDGSWRATLRGDAYWQSQSWARVYNDNPYDKLHGWYNVNLSVWLEKPDDGLKVELYAKNLLDKTPITDAFLNSDDTALTTNVFVLDPRLIGLSVRKEF